MNNESDIAFEEPEASPEPTTENKLIKPGKAKKYVLDYDGKTGALYKLFLLDFFMRIITIGIYSFWGKTRLRKYIFSRHALDGDRFEYTGTGGELFKGFLKVLPILVILFVPLALQGVNPLFSLFYIPLVYCVGIAIYGATRYRYSRTRWRGVRGYLDGSTIGYANLAFGRMLLNFITLGFAIPSSDIAKHRYIMNNAYFGNVKAEFTGDSKVLFGAYIKSMLLVFFLFIALGGLFYASFAMAQNGDYSGYDQSQYSSEEKYDDMNFSEFNSEFGHLAGELNAHTFIIATASFLVIFIPFLIFPIARSIYVAALMREKMRGLKVGHLKFMCTVTAGKLIKHKMANALILLLTLGLGFPYIVQRNIRFMVRHHIIMGDLKAFQAEQGKDQCLTSGEGLETGFDIDAGFF